MAKNIVLDLNHADKIWVNIINIKYPNLSLSSNQHFNSTSWLFKSLSQTSISLGFNFKINVCNPHVTDLWLDPWLH